MIRKAEDDLKKIEDCRLWSVPVLREIGRHYIRETDTLHKLLDREQAENARLKEQVASLSREKGGLSKANKAYQQKVEVQEAELRVLRKVDKRMDWQDRVIENIFFTVGNNEAAMEHNHATLVRLILSTALAGQEERRELKSDLLKTLGSMMAIDTDQFVTGIAEQPGKVMAMLKRSILAALKEIE